MTGERGPASDQPQASSGWPPALIGDLGLIAGICIVSHLGYCFVVPALPPFEWPPEWGPTPELAQAKSAYFLPKSFEILFQQILILALVLSLARQGLSLRRISLVCAALFGGSHLPSAFDTVLSRSVARFAVVATLFGLIFPVLILRVRNGLACSHAVHWLCCALSVVMARAVGPTTVGPVVRRLFGVE